MTSFIQTMFVSNPSLQPFSASPKPLPALSTSTNVCGETDLHALRSADFEHFEPISPSELQRRIQDIFDSDPSAALVLPFQEPKNLAVQRKGNNDDLQRTQPQGLGVSILEVVNDRLTHDCSNARNRNQASFQPRKNAKGTNSWQLKQFAEATLGSGSLRKVVRLPEGENRDEWLAVNVVDFYNQINLLYGAITEFCSPTTCPEMKATDEFEYLWHDPPTYPKPTRLPAPTYISCLLTWTSNHLSNPNVFPTHPGVPFPANFQITIRTIFKRLYRIYAHIYCHHYGVVRGLGLEAHLNTGFKHYVLFVEEFDLADGKGEKKSEWFGPLGELVESMLRSD